MYLCEHVHVLACIYVFNKYTISMSVYRHIVDSISHMDIIACMVKIYAEVLPVCCRVCWMVAYIRITMI